ncbi:MAG: YkgJ family cysteine cluster protein [Halobacteriales archaeon]
MEVDCEGCAGCCLDWRPLVEDPPDHERRGPRDPLDDAYNLVPLTRDDARGLLEAGLAAATTPRLFRDEDGLEVDGRTVAAVDGKPAFFLGLRKPPKPVAPFGVEPAWLPSCVFLDPDTLQCRIHGDELYPQECADYPGHNLDLGAETECERVEASFGGERLLDAAVPETLPDPLLGPQALGQVVFVHPEPARLDGVVERVAGGGLTPEDRAEFLAAAVAGSPGTTTTNTTAYREARERALDAEAWVAPAIAEWERLADAADADPALGERVEDDRGAPPTPGWESPE